MDAKQRYPEPRCICGGRQTEIVVPLTGEERAAWKAKPCNFGFPAAPTHKMVWTASGRLDAIGAALSRRDSIMAAYHMGRWAPFIEETADDTGLASLAALRAALSELMAHEALHGCLSRLDRGDESIMRYERNMKD